jgi:hypothetical protein
LYIEEIFAIERARTGFEVRQVFLETSICPDLFEDLVS